MPTTIASNPRLSIITVNRNNRAGLAKTLRSVHEEQSFIAFEHFVVDGGSTDGSVEVIRRHEDHLARWVSEPDNGIYHAMNKGIAMARGEYLLFLNSGDWLVPDILRVLFSDFPAADIVYGNLQFVEGDKPGYVWIPPEPDHLNFTFWVRGSIPHGATFIRRSLLAENGYNLEFRIIADREFFFRTYLKGMATFAHVDRLVGFFVRGGISNDPRHAQQRQDEIDRLFDPHLRLLDLPRLFRDDKMLAVIIRREYDCIQQSEQVRQCLCRWTDVFFWLYRFLPTRVGLIAFTRLIRNWEERRVRRRIKSEASPPDRR